MSVLGCPGQQATSHTSWGCTQVATVLSPSLAGSYSNTCTCSMPGTHSTCWHLQGTTAAVARGGGGTWSAHLLLGCFSLVRWLAVLG